MHACTHTWNTHVQTYIYIYIAHIYTCVHTYHTFTNLLLDQKASNCQTNYICMSHEEHKIPKTNMVVMMQMVHNWDHPGQWDTFQRINIHTHTCICLYWFTRDLVMCLWLSMPVMLSFISSATKPLLPELFNDISWFVSKIFVMRREHTESQSCLSKKISIPDSTATDYIVYISCEQTRKCGHLDSTWQFETHMNKYWLHPKRSWTYCALPSSGCNIWTRFRLVIGRLKWLSCVRCHLIFQHLIPWPQPLN